MSVEGTIAAARGKVCSSPHASQHNLTRCISHPGGSGEPDSPGAPRAAGWQWEIVIYNKAPLTTIGTISELAKWHLKSGGTKLAFLHRLPRRRRRRTNVALWLTVRPAWEAAASFWALTPAESEGRHLGGRPTLRLSGSNRYLDPVSVRLALGLTLGLNLYISV